MTEKDFTEIVSETKGAVLSAIRKHLQEDYYEAIDDVVQETYLRAYKGLVKKSFRGDSSLSTWIYAIARNESLRMNGKMNVKEKTERNLMQRERDALREERHGEIEERESLLSLIQNLPDKYRAVLELVSLGLTETQISERLQISRGTVKSRSYRGRELLQKIWKEDNQ